MSLPIFPMLAGQGWSVHKRPTFSTIVANHASGREVRESLYVNPIWQFEVNFDGLDSTTSGQYGGLGAQSMQALMGLFLQCQGQFSPFIYYDPTDYFATGQLIGAGDGATTTFQIARTLGGFTEPVIAPVTAATTLNFPGQGAVPASAPTLSVAGSVLSGSAYSITSPGGVVTFASPPAIGAALTWTGAYGFLCRFDADDLDFEQFMANLWKLESVKFRSLRAQ